MTGDEHYAEAERLVALAEDASVRTPEGATAYGMMAQVHATLALTAVTLDAAFVIDRDGAAGPRVVDVNARGGWGYGS